MRINMMVLIIDNALVMTGINDEQSGHYVSLLGATVDRKFFSLNCSAGSCHIGGPPWTPRYHITRYVYVVSRGL